MRVSSHRTEPSTPTSGLRAIGPAPTRWARTGTPSPAAATARTASIPVAKALTMIAPAPAATAAAARSTRVSTGPETLAA